MHSVNQILIECRKVGTLVALSFPFATVQSQSIELVEIPAGTFYMGSCDKGGLPDELPIHVVTISHPFKMGATEVTNAQFEEFMPEHRALRGKNGVSNGDDEAVVNVTYDDAVAYCKWLSEKDGITYRLPTEAEWEYACRAGTYTRYYTGDWLGNNMARNQTITRDYKLVDLTVGKTTPNAFGLYDMHGNVEEWCSDWYGEYDNEPVTDPAGLSMGEYKVTRGGSHNTPSIYLRSASRLAMIPSDKHSLTGFRVVQSDFDPAEALNPSNSEPLFAEPIPFVIAPNDPSVRLLSHNHQPAITYCDNGDLIAIWFSADEENSRDISVLGSRLKKGSKQWTPATTFFKVPGRNITGSSLLNYGDGRLIHLNGVEAAGDWQNLALVMRESTDNGYTWSSPTMVAPEHTKRHQVIAGPSVDSNGRILQGCDAGPGGQDGTALHVSTDGGATWTDMWNGEEMSTFDDGATGTTIAGIHAGIVTLSDGTIMALGRGNSITNSDGLPRMPMSISKDGGHTWTYSASPFPPIDGGQRLVLTKLPGGELLLISFTEHPERTPKEQRGMEFIDVDGNKFVGHGMYAAVSYDDGKTWPVRRLLTDGQERFLDGGAWTGNFLMDSTHSEPRGYLAATVTPDGAIHLVSSRIYYRFNLPWIEGPYKF